MDTYQNNLRSKKGTVKAANMNTLNNCEITGGGSSPKLTSFLSSPLGLFRVRQSRMVSLTVTYYVHSRSLYKSLALSP